MQSTAQLHRKRPLRRDGPWATFFLLPTLIGFLVFTLFPVIMSLFYSFTNYDGITPYRMVGFQNYSRLLRNREFIQSLKNTIVFALGTVPLGAFLSLIVAVVLNQDIPLKKFYRTCFFMPTVVSMIAISVVFQLIFNQENRLAHNLLSYFGIPPQKWFGSVTQAMPCVIFVTIWQSMGTQIVIFLAGLTAVDSALYEAAKIDGATAVKQFWHITLPAMRPTITFVLISNTIGAFQAFDQIYMLTSGGPAKATQTISYLLYMNAFSYYKQGYASAMAYLLFIVIMLISVAQLRISSQTNN